MSSFIGKKLDLFVVTSIGILTGIYIFQPMLDDVTQSFHTSQDVSSTESIHEHTKTTDCKDTPNPFIPS